ncbi:MAG: fatty acid desaturase [Actinomycetota bacterium]
MSSIAAGEARDQAARTRPSPEPSGLDAGISNDIPMSLKWTLVDHCGVPYREFRKTLIPRWRRIWLEIAAAYGVLALTLAGLAAWSPSLPVAIPAALTGAVLIGYTIQYLNNFFHEAAHYNLAPGRARNDRLTNLLMGWMFGSSIDLYRRTHFQHHRALGTTEDSESSYFDVLGIRYLAEGLFGIKAVRSLRRWRRTQQRLDARAPARLGRSRLAWIAIAATVNLGLASLLGALGSPAAAVAWLAGLLVIFPFLASLRQLLEHRSEQASARVDYTQVDHGPVNRLFGDGPIASTLGSAGFNRHALHHWEPQTSYTRLKEIEAYLLRTPIAEAVRERQTSYRDTFLRLLEL